jgi:hypothetical protein
MSLESRLGNLERRIPSNEDRVTRVIWRVVDPKDWPNGGPISQPVGPDLRPESEKPRLGEPVPWEFENYVPT